MEKRVAKAGIISYPRAAVADFPASAHGLKVLLE